MFKVSSNLKLDSPNIWKLGFAYLSVDIHDYPKFHILLLYPQLSEVLQVFQSSDHPEIHEDKQLNKKSILKSQISFGEQQHSTKLTNSNSWRQERTRKKELAQCYRERNYWCLVKSRLKTWEKWRRSKEDNSKVNLTGCTFTPLSYTVNDPTTNDSPLPPSKL